MEKEINKLTMLAYKNKFSIYYKPDNCLIRTYLKDGNQHKEEGETIEEAVGKMIHFLKNKKM